MSGTWEERSYGLSGRVSGATSGNRLRLVFRGSLSGAMLVTTHGGSQSISVRTDIAARMQSIQAPVQMCYAVALERNRKLKGIMMVSFRAAPSTGQFDQITVTRDEVGDPQVRTCVIEQVGKLKLETPQKTAVTVSYPLEFQPAN